MTLIESDRHFTKLSYGIFGIIKQLKKSDVTYHIASATETDQLLRSPWDALKSDGTHVRN